jgi:DNA-binding PadR family transcriptional regulator
MKRSMIRLVWPRAESKLYEEPKNLVAHGLARARAERVGDRRRTVYHLTPRGRRALRRWLGEPGGGLLVEFEMMIKVVYGDFGTKEQLLTNLHRIADSMRRRSRLALPLAEELATTGARFPARAHINALADRFIVDIMQATLGWAVWAEGMVSRWPGTGPDEAITAQAKTVLAENAAALRAMAQAVSAAEG